MLGVIGLVLFGRPLAHVLTTAWSDRDARPALPPGFVDDASRLNATAVREVIAVASDAADAEQQVVALIERAAREDMRIAIAGARHTMGGHTISPDGIVLDMTSLDHLRLDADAATLTAGAGARWSEIIAYLDARGWSVAIMQSNNSFTVGGSISANCHGWQHGRAPIASSIRRFRIALADGRIVTCSRNENAELFSLALGGYGLFGVILEAGLEVVPNERYTLDRSVIPTRAFVTWFADSITNGRDVGLAYARLCVVPDTFLDEAIVNVFRASPCPPAEIPALGEPALAGIKRTIFRGSIDSDYGKRLRWDAEKTLSQHVATEHFSRNQLLNEGTDIYENRSAESTDILHEYFVPPEAFDGFLADMRRLIPPHAADLLNVTVRHVLPDGDTYLRYADREMLALVLLFNQKTTAAAEQDMQRLTRELVSAALGRGGRYYLPYRLHATPEQFRRAYPQAETFFRLKREHDPDGLFSNMFYERYGVVAETGG